MTIESGSCQVLYRKKRIEGPGPLAYLWHPSSARSAVTKLLSKTPWWYESIEETPSSGIKNSLYKYCTLHISSSTEMSGHLGMFPPNTHKHNIYIYFIYISSHLLSCYHQLPCVTMELVQRDLRGPGCFGNPQLTRKFRIDASLHRPQEKTHPLDGWVLTNPGKTTQFIGTSN